MWGKPKNLSVVQVLHDFEPRRNLEQSIWDCMSSGLEVAKKISQFIKDVKVNDFSEKAIVAWGEGFVNLVIFLVSFLEKIPSLNANSGVGHLVPLAIEVSG